MMLLRDIRGIGGVPTDKTSARAWCDRNNVATRLVSGIGGKNYEIDEHTLPLAILEAVKARFGVSAPIEMGEIDTELQALAAGKSRAIQQEGRLRAALLMVFQSAFVETGSKSRAYKSVEAHCVAKDIHCPSEVVVRRWRALTAAVSATNWPFVLCRDTAPGAAKLDGLEDFWLAIEASITESDVEVTFKGVYQDAKQYCEAKGYKYPAESTARTHWESRPYGERVIRNLGPTEGRRALHQSITRDKSGLASMEKLTLDARRCEVEVEFEDGTTGHPWVTAFTDEASTKTVGWEFSKSENAETTAELTLETFNAHGIPDNITTDNGASFCSHLLAGRVPHKFRGSHNRDPSLEPLGIWPRLGVDVHYCKPGNPRGKTAESAFRTMARKIDQSWIFKGAYTGSRERSRSKGPRRPMPFAEFKDKYSAEIRRINAEPGRKGQNTKGSSYDDTFEACKGTRLKRQMTPDERELCSRVWYPRMVNSNGQVRVPNRIYGLDCTYDKLMACRERGERVFVGIDPNDPTRPAIIEDKNRKIISASVLLDDPTIHGDKAGAAEAGRRGKAARKHDHVWSPAEQAAREELLDDMLNVRMEQYGVEPEKTPEKVVRLNFSTSPKRAPISDDDDWNPVFAENEQRRRKELRAAKRA